MFKCKKMLICKAGEFESLLEFVFSSCDTQWSLNVVQIPAFTSLLGIVPAVSHLWFMKLNWS